ncbi:MAG: hypothetical protein ACLTJ5_11715 [Clostridium sp.]
MNVSIADLKKNYDKLDVHFDLWKKESDVQEYIPDMVSKLKEDGFAYESEGALGSGRYGRGEIKRTTSVYYR